MPPTKKVQSDSRKEKIASGALTEAVLDAKVAESKKRKAGSKKKPAVEVDIPTADAIKFNPLKKDALQVVWVPVGTIHPNPDNPNVMDDKQFNNLVQAIRDIGFREPIEIVPIVDEDDARYDATTQQYELIGGEHRLEALKVLQWKDAPCLIDLGASRTSKDSRDALLVKRNMIKGELSPEKFTKLYEKMLPKYGSDNLADMMSFADKETMDGYILAAEETLPDTPEAKAEFKKQKKNIKTVEDLSRIINMIFTKYGSTVDLSFMSYEYGGHTHMVVWMDKPVKSIVEEITTYCTENQLDINTVIHKVFTSGWDATMLDSINTASKAEAVPAAGKKKKKVVEPIDDDLFYDAEDDD